MKALHRLRTGWNTALVEKMGSRVPVRIRLQLAPHESFFLNSGQCDYTNKPLMASCSMRKHALSTFTSISVHSSVLVSVLITCHVRQLNGKSLID